MDCTQAIRARRSIRRYQPGAPVPEEDVKLMLEAAMLAPSACNSRPWEFFVAEGPVKDRLHAIHPYAGMLETASLAIVVCARPEDQSGKAAGFWPLDCGAAVENLLLQAAALGYGACWCGCWPREARAADVQKALGVQSVPVALIAVGVPDEDPPARGFYDPKRVTWLRGEGGTARG